MIFFSSKSTAQEISFSGMRPFCFRHAIIMAWLQCILVILQDGGSKRASVSSLFWSRFALWLSSETTAIASSKTKFLLVKSRFQSTFKSPLDFQIHRSAFRRQFLVSRFMDFVWLDGYGNSMLHIGHCGIWKYNLSSYLRIPDEFDFCCSRCRC